ncbi:MULTISPECIES: hypothetical protein [unclassified Paraflavitalea]|uniref:hypothetical protein n=1 Tax=unclassified Paraflavitalea TaxID=2798305 RepID=UPI003D335279
MLTSEKVEIFRRYKGNYDGYHIQSKGKEKLISDDEWFLLSNLMQDIYLIRSGIAAKSFERKIVDELTKSCDSTTTYNLIFELEKYINDKSI